VSVREFNGTSDQLTVDVGDAAGFQYGTIAMLVKTLKANDFQALGYFHGSGGGWVSNPLGIANFNLWTSDPGGSNFVGAGPVVDVWYLLVWRKETGTNAPRLSAYNFTDDVWVHVQGNASISDFPAAGAGGTIQHAFQGGSSSFFGGRMAARAYWTNNALWSADNTSDAAIEAAGLELAASNWAALDPSVFHLYNQTSTSDPLLDLSTSGTANQTAISGTSISSDDPPGFQFASGPTPLTRAVSSETARPLAAAASTPLGLSASTETARGLAPSATHVFGRAVETSSARAAVPTGLVAFRRAVEAGIARVLGSSGLSMFGRVSETDAARPFVGDNPVIKVQHRGQVLTPVQVGIIRNGVFVPSTHWEVSGDA
jgi:hypothetical protein